MSKATLSEEKSGYPEGVPEDLLEELADELEEEEEEEEPSPLEIAEAAVHLPGPGHVALHADLEALAAQLPRLHEQAGVCRVGDAHVVAFGSKQSGGQRQRLRQVPARRR